MTTQKPTLSIWSWLATGLALLGCVHNPGINRTQLAKLSDGISWIEDDYAGALLQAQGARKPILIEMWAPWCHSCLSMKQFILNDPGLKPFAERFVWLAIDTEKATNAPVLEKFPVQAWPTFLVVSSVDESIQAVQVGSESVSQFREFLGDGQSGHLDALARGKLLAADDPLRWVRDGDRACLAGDLEGATEAYRRALAEASSVWPRRAELLSRSIYLLYQTGRFGDCVQSALDHLNELGLGPSAVDALAAAFECVGALPQADARRDTLAGRSIAMLTALTRDPSAPLSADDRSEAFRLLREILESRGERDRARSVALSQHDLLEQAAAKAGSPLAASTYNGPRAELALYLGRGEQIIQVLEASEKALPGQYDPPFRQAWVQLQLGRPEAALECARRALALCQGPRTARIHALIADIHRARKDTDLELQARKAALGVYTSLPKGQRRPIEEKRAREAIDALLSLPAPGGIAP